MTYGNRHHDARGRAFRLLAALWFCLLTSARYQDIADEYDVKAAYLLNFARYVTSLNPGQGNYQIGVLKPNPIRAEVLRDLQAKQVGNRPVKIQDFEADDDWTGCDLLFVPGKDPAAAEKIKAIVERLGSKPVIVVAECDGAADAGALLGFVVQDSRVRFEVSKRTAQRNKLSIDAKLAKLAARIAE